MQNWFRWQVWLYRYIRFTFYFLPYYTCVRSGVRACLRECVCACVRRPCVCACVRACVRCYQYLNISLGEKES